MQAIKFPTNQIRFKDWICAATRSISAAL